MGSPPQVRGKPDAFGEPVHVDRITPAGAGKTSLVLATCSDIMDHPRRCGENGIMRCRAWLRTGSPPQVRGKHYLRVPAASCAVDHPRRCGENDLYYIDPSDSEGSPPQVRGKLDRCMGAAAARRITPAGAGKTSDISELLWSRRDHPRRCGENETVCRQVAARLGSPPQVRGKQCAALTRFNCFRITPAGAGKTLKRSFRNQPFCSGAVQISFNFSNSLNVSLQSGSAR